MKIEITKRVSIRKIAVIVLLLLVTGVFTSQLATVNAQSYQPCKDPLIPDTWCYGQINSVYPERHYQFYGYAGEDVSISMERDEAWPALDPYLELKDSYGYIVASDDDSLSNGNSWISSYRLRSSGSYTIIARSYNNLTVGKFWLYLAKS